MNTDKYSKLAVHTISMMPPPRTPVVDHSTPGSILLAHVPKNDQVRILRTLIESLQMADRSGMNLVASLIMQQTDQLAKQDFMSLLEKAIRNGEVQNAISIGLKFPLFGNELLQKAAEAISKAKSIRAEEQDDNGAVQSYLLFAKSTICHLPIIEAHSIIFKACLALMGTESKQTSVALQDVVFTLLSATDEAILNDVVLPSQHLIWKGIQNLVTSNTNKTYSLWGYSVWLRWILSVKGTCLREFIGNDYWHLLIHGLRHGDSERRKLCLSILKLTMEADSTLVSNDACEQYHRYCTVFETIVLGRYINQIQECENDLNFLATDSSLQPQWLYTLLASALDGRMQDSNRKFIGNWVMRSGLKPTTEFVQFFQHDFLPWAILGQLFVSTLKKQNGELRCFHGDRLSQFLRRLLRDCAEPRRLTNITVETMLRKRHSVFAYATVYLLEGLGGTLESDQMEKISELTSLPEVARDFVNIRSCKCLDHNVKTKLISRREALEQQAIEKCNFFDADVNSLEKIWGDLEYLEYPKRLLMVLPGVILNPSVVERAIKEPTLAFDLAEKLQTLRNIAATKTFLFSPLVTALRKTLSTNPAALDVLKFVEFIVWVTEHPPEPTIDLMLEEATIPLTPFSYEHYFGERSSYGFAAFLDLVSRLQDSQDVVRQVLHYLVQRWKDQKVPPPTVSSWKTTLQLQVLLLCFEQFIPDSTAQIHDLLEDLFHILAIEPLPRYRYLLEWIIVRLFLRYLLRDILLKRLATKDHHSSPKHLASLMKIGVILACGPLSEERFALELATIFAPLAASSKVVIRHEAQWQLPLLMDHARRKEWVSITENPAFSALDEYIRNLERFHDPPMERRVGRFDPATDHTLTNLAEGLWFDLDQTDAPLTSRAEFVKLCDTAVGLDLPQACMPLGNKIDRPIIQQDGKIDDKLYNMTLGQGTADEVTALQTKGTAYLDRTLSDPSSHHARSNDIIVVGSLVENPYNLGGLSRVSEIFGASALCLQNQNVLSNKDFTSVSVSSHLHFLILQLSASCIPEFLAERKSEGFTVLGIEQTDRSVILGSEDAQLPKRVVLIVGSEREGIPAIVLTECDLLVEIPQQGITRSLNVQTAVSILLYEHARQHK